MSPNPHASPKCANAFDDVRETVDIENTVSLECNFSYNALFFKDEKEDGTFHTFCWSLSSHTEDRINYIWHVYSNFQPEPVFGLYQQFRYHGPSPFPAGDYLFYAELGSRAVWKQLKSSGLFASPYSSMDLYTAFEPDKSKSSTTIVIANNVLATHLPMQVPLTYAPQVLGSHIQPHKGPFHDPTDTPPSCPVSTPESTQYSDASSDTSVETCSSDFKAEHVPRGSGRYFYTAKDGQVSLFIPDHLRTLEDVKAFLASALNSGDLDRGTRRVRCSLCWNKRHKKDNLWEVKPSNLERHILAHLGIKCFHCRVNGCEGAFTTKDQLKKHTAKKHMDVQIDTGDDGDYEATDEITARDMYMPTSPVPVGQPIDETLVWDVSPFEAMEAMMHFSTDDGFGYQSIDADVFSV
ncbi:hypothetical protein RHS04_09124 [Rhizoctonia solani]|uniref:C2H2-type domain-containing protein n=1 Tax=Rhizoctonia solani TaxID=456999 RepID=A0A8H7GYL5_9AGAM|nr:hypothetical protein RHS04_09124 [Rhizoctonia solani]